MTEEKMPQTPDIAEMIKWSAIGGAIGGFARSAQTNSFGKALVDCLLGGALSLAVCGAAYACGVRMEITWFFSGFIGAMATFTINWMQRLAGMVMLWIERRFWSDYDRENDGPKLM